MKHDWNQLAQAAGRAAGRERLDRSVRHWIETEDRAGRTWGIACSGGPDSLLMLLLLGCHFPDRMDRMRVLHFDHRLRGRESAGDARFVRAVAVGLGLDFRMGEWAERPPEPADASESAAREARFAFFAQALSDGEEPALFLGHQKDDVLETQLMRLCRGSGSAGLAAPRPVGRWRGGRVHLRPLLDFSGAQIRALLGENRIPFREDSTNRSRKFLRNRIRHSVIPALRSAVEGAAEEGAALSREILQEEDEALETWLRSFLPPAGAGSELCGAALEGKPRALWRRALDEWLRVNGMRGNLSRAAFETLLSALESGRSGRFSAGRDRWAVVAGRAARILTPSPTGGGRLKAPWPLPCGSVLFLPGGNELMCRVIEVDAKLSARLREGRVDPREEAFLACRDEGEVLHVRHWEPGDRFHPLGAPGSRKLQDWFTDRRVPRETRPILPVVFSRSAGTVWVPGFPPAESRRLDPGTKLAVWLTYRMLKPA